MQTTRPFFGCLLLCMLLITVWLEPRYSAEASSPTMDIVLVIDVSSSIYSKVIQEPGILDGIEQFVLHLPENTQSVSLLTFNGKTYVDIDKQPLSTPEERQAAAENVKAALSEQFQRFKDDLLGTSIGKGMQDGAALFQNLGDPSVLSVMVLMTDAINSESGHIGYDEQIKSVLENPDGNIIVCVMETVSKPAEEDQNEKKVNLADIANKTGGIRYVETILSSVSDRFADLNDNLNTLIVTVADVSESVIDPPDTDSPNYISVSEASEISDTISDMEVPDASDTTVVMSTDGEISITLQTQQINDKPLTEIGLMAGDDLIAQGLITRTLQDKTTIESHKALYQQNKATFYIRKDGDSSFHSSQMTPNESSYRTIMTLPDDGQYEFYIVLEYEGVHLESEHQTIIVYPAYTPAGVTMDEMPRSIQIDSSKGPASFAITAKIQPNDLFEGKEIYYNRYKAVAYIRAKGASKNLEQYSTMVAKGDSFFTDVFELVDEGVYVYSVEVTANGETIRSLEREIVIEGIITPIMIALIGTLSLLLFGLAIYIQFNVKHYDFVIAVSDKLNPCVLTFGVHFNTLNKYFYFKHLLRENSFRLQRELVEDLSPRQKKLLSALQNANIRMKFQFNRKNRNLTVNKYSSETIVHTVDEGSKKVSLQIGDSLAFISNEKGISGFEITILYVNNKLSRIGR